MAQKRQQDQSGSSYAQDNGGLEGQFRKLSLESLGHGKHVGVFSRALFNVLTTDVAELTYAQIIDGAPLSNVIQDTYGPNLSDQHPVYDEHPEICPGVLDRIRQIYADFDASILEFDNKLIHEYHAASPGSRAFNTRLIEMVAVAVHAIGVYLFNLNLDIGHHKDLVEWQPEEDDVFWYYHPKGPLPTLFIHRWYQDHDQYPHGVADVVGYWAEARIMGGVVLFDRRAAGQREAHEDPEAIYLHTDRPRRTYRIWQLLDTQKKRLLDFLLSDRPSRSSPCSDHPFPFLPDENNNTRIDAQEPIAETGIYRDIWERKAPPDGAPDARLKDVSDFLNYLTENDHRRSGAAAYERKLAADERIMARLKAERDKEEQR